MKLLIITLGKLLAKGYSDKCCTDSMFHFFFLCNSSSKLRVDYNEHPVELNVSIENVSHPFIRKKPNDSELFDCVGGLLVVGVWRLGVPNCVMAVG